METFVITAAVGVVVGILSGLLGIGGGTLMVPLFRLGFGLSALASTATSLFTIIPTSLVGFITHIKNKTCIPQLGIVCGLAGACTSPLGVHLANMSPAWMVMLAAAIIIGFSSFKMFRKAARMPKNPASGKAMGVDENAFAETMNTWNGYVEAKNDPDFGRTSFANPLNTAPYYAIKVTAGVHHTMGGLKINTNTEVLKADGSVIPGLFAAGEVTGGVHGANRLGGNAVADFTVFGRIAGAAASKYAA